MANEFLNDDSNEEEKELNEVQENFSEEIEDEDDKSAAETEKEEQPLPPRKRKIVKNYQLPVSAGIVLIALLVILIWNSFFNQSVTGVWHYINSGSYTETYDEPTATPDGVATETIEYTQRVCYEFTDDGRCIVTLGTTGVEGQYELYSSEEGPVLSAYVFNNYSAVMYGNYSCEVKGNIFTGRKLILTGMSTGEVIELEEGEGENPLVPFENANIDERFTGTWRDEAYGLTYEFTDDGYMTLTADDGMVVEHVYTIVEEGTMLVKYYGSDEFSYSFVYSFDDDGNLTFNGSSVEKID